MVELEASAGGSVNGCSSDGVAWLSSPYSPSARRYPDGVDSACSTPYYSAPSSPGRGHPGYYFSAPASPMQYVLSSSPSCPYTGSASSEAADGSFEFEFSWRFPKPSDPDSAAAGSMSSADELFLNGQIRPLRLQRPGGGLAPVADLEEEGRKEGEGGVVRSMRMEAECGEPVGGWGRRELGLRSKSLHRRARSMSPLRSAPAFGRWQVEQGEEESIGCGGEMSDSVHGRVESKQDGEGEECEPTATAPGSPPASRSSLSSRASSCRNSKRWVFLKDFLYRSKSEGSASGKEKFWHNISFSPAVAREKTSSLLFFSNKAAKSKEESDDDPRRKEDKKNKNNNNKKKSSSTACPGSSISPTATSSDGNSNNSESKMSSTSSPPRLVNGVVRKRRKPAPSPHERHYAANRAQAEELRRRTFLPYRQGLLSCLGFSSRGCYAMNGLARTLNTVSSR